MKRLFILLIPLLLMGCEDESQTQDVDKSGSIEMVLSTKHVGDVDIVTTQRTFWANNIQVKKDVIIDTIKALPKVKEVGEDESGNQKEISVQKEYQFFITVQ